MSESAAPLPPVPPAASSPTASPAAAPEEVIYDGPVSLWLGWRALAGAACACLAGLGLLCGSLFVSAQWLHTALVVGGGALALAGCLMLPFVVLSLRAFRYRITTRLIEREQGLISKKVDNLDLGRIKDVQLRQDLAERLLDLGSILVFSSDSSDPALLIEGLPGARRVYERLRDAVMRASRARGVMPLDR